MMYAGDECYSDDVTSGLDDEEPCATEGCDGSMDDGEGEDGYCGNCADRIYASEHPDDEP